MSTRRREGGCLTFRLRLRIYHIFSPNELSLWYKITGMLTVKIHFKATEAEDKVVSFVQIFCTGMRMLVYQRKIWLNTKQSEQQKLRRSSSLAC